MAYKLALTLCLLATAFTEPLVARPPPRGPKGPKEPKGPETTLLSTTASSTSSTTSSTTSTTSSTTVSPETSASPSDALGMFPADFRPQFLHVVFLHLGINRIRYSRRCWTCELDWIQCGVDTVGKGRCHCDPIDHYNRHDVDFDGAMPERQR